MVGRQGGNRSPDKGKDTDGAVVTTIYSSSTETEIPDLISRIALGDRGAFSKLYALTGPKLFGVCIRILKDRVQAEDAIQEVYVKIWQRAGSFRPTGAAPMGWLVTIARNHCIDLARARAPDTVNVEEEYTLADPDPDPEASAIISSEGRRIDRCLDELDPGKAKAVVSAYVEGLSYQELAVAYDVPLNTMRTWLRRSLLKLRECMQR